MNAQDASPIGTPQLPTDEYEDEDSISLLDLALVAAENLRLLVLGPLAAGVAALAISFSIAPTFTATAVFMPPQQQQSSAAAALQGLGALAGMAGGAAGLKNPADQYVSLTQSTTIADRLIDRFKLMEVYDQEYRSKARKELEGNSRISAGKKDGLITVEVDDEDRQRAADMANAYVDELQQLISRLAITEAQQRRVFFEKQLTKTQAQLIAAQRALQAAGINEGAIRAEPKAAAEAYAALRAEVTAAEVRLQSMRGYLAESAPDFKQAQNQLAALRMQIAKFEGVNTVASQGDYIERYREFKYQETLFDLFSRQFEIAKVDEGREGAVIQVVDAATPPDRKSKPKKALISVAAALSAALGLLLFVLVGHSLRTARHDTATAAKLACVTSAIRRSLGRGSV
jgi:uncharacterized protein involved in exopolysaccharide biosynthesis